MTAEEDGFDFTRLKRPEPAMPKAMPSQVSLHRVMATIPSSPPHEKEPKPEPQHEKVTLQDVLQTLRKMQDHAVGILQRSHKLANQLDGPQPLENLTRSTGGVPATVWERINVEVMQFDRLLDKIDLELARSGAALE